MPRPSPPPPPPQDLLDKLAPALRGWDVKLVLQGGGARAAYQVGVYEALRELNAEPTWVSGISMGAVNAAVMAGNRPEHRLKKLEGFWDSVATRWDWTNAMKGLGGEAMKRLAATWESYMNMYGHRNFYRLRIPNVGAWPPGTPGATSYYEAWPLRKNLERWVDLAAWNDLAAPGAMGCALGATDIQAGTLHFWDSAKEPLGLDMVMAASAMPPGSAAVKVGDGWYWDGGVASNDPQVALLESGMDGPKTLVVLVDLWAADDSVPRTIDEVSWRQYQIQYQSSVTTMTRMLGADLGAGLVQPGGDVTLPSTTSAAAASAGDVAILHLIYNSTIATAPYDSVDFSVNSTLERRAYGRSDLVAALGALAPSLLAPPGSPVLLRFQDDAVQEFPGSFLPGR